MLIGLMNKRLEIYGILGSSSSSEKKKERWRIDDAVWGKWKALSGAFREEAIDNKDQLIDQTGKLL